jgi:hypothetical protein
MNFIRKLTTKDHIEIHILESTIMSLIKLQDQWFDLSINLLELSQIWWFDKYDNFKDRVDFGRSLADHWARLNMKFKEAGFIELFLQLICVLWKDFFESIDKQEKENIWIYNMVLYGCQKDYLNGIDKLEWQVIVDISDNHDLKFELKMIKNQMINIKFMNAFLVYEPEIAKKINSNIYSFYANFVLSLFIVWLMAHQEKHKDDDRKLVVSHWDIPNILSSIFVFKNMK